MHPLAKPAVAILAAFLAGCMGGDSVSGLAPGKLVVRDTLSSPVFPGLFMEGEIHLKDDVLTYAVRVHNDGTTSYHHNAGCGYEGRFTLRDPNGSLFEHHNATNCAGYSDAVLAPTGHVELRDTWNGTAYDSATDTWSAMPPGTYTWSASFVMEEGALTLTLHLERPPP
ncbi:MAG TPA: hypothetical protein VI796_01085 [Candidatus Thermoplasmatota archaeon]|nr:hypothetical protein [Candidatus Thermoplasmatota archaeon]